MVCSTVSRHTMAYPLMFLPRAVSQGIPPLHSLVSFLVGGFLCPARGRVCILVVCQVFSPTSTSQQTTFVWRLVLRYLALKSTDGLMKRKHTLKKALKKGGAVGAMRKKGGTVGAMPPYHYLSKPGGGGGGWGGGVRIQGPGQAARVLATALRPSFSQSLCSTDDGMLRPGLTNVILGVKPQRPRFGRTRGVHHVSGIPQHFENGTVLVMETCTQQGKPIVLLFFLGP